MGTQIKQLPDGSTGMEGSAGGDGGFLPVSIPYSVPSGTVPMFIADRPYIVKAIRARQIAVGTGGACTVSFYKSSSGTAIGSGTVLHSSSYNMVGTANTSYSMTLSTTASDLVLAAGDAIGYVVTGTATSATGVFTITLNPA